MASHEDHCAECLEQLGEEFSEVHLWLDEFAQTKGPAHRSIRHHQASVGRIRDRWGDRAAQAAEIHIKRDCYGKVPTVEEVTLAAALEGVDVEG